MLLQKCRDSQPTVLDAEIRSTPGGVRWMRIGANGGAMFAMNAHGVAVTVNTGNKLVGAGILRKGKREPKPLFDRIMEECSRAEQGVAIIERHFRNPAGIYIIADPKRAFLTEAGAGYGAHLELTGGIFVTANEMHLPGVDEFNTSTANAVMRQRAREANARRSLRETRDANGRYTRAGMFRTSRNVTGERNAEQNVFRKHSLGGCCFEPDAEFPAELSTAYIAIGPQLHSIYLPTPMALEQFPDKIRNGTWGENAKLLFRLLGNVNPHLEKITELEIRMLREYDSVRDAARQLLRDGKREEAVALLNACYARQFSAADELMGKIRRDAERKLDGNAVGSVPPRNTALNQPEQKELLAK